MRVVSLLALSAIAYAAHSEPRVDVVEEPGLWELRDNTGTPLKNDKNIAIRVPTLEQCKLESIKAFGAAQVVELGYRCHQVVRLTVKGSCTVATPEPARPVDEEGFTVLEAVPEPALCADGLSFDIRERQWLWNTRDAANTKTSSGLLAANRWKGLSVRNRPQWHRSKNRVNGLLVLIFLWIKNVRLQPWRVATTRLQSQRSRVPQISNPRIIRSIALEASRPARINFKFIDTVQ
jgi:hypothetical protein